MIGIKIKNSVWRETLLRLLSSQAEIWQAKNTYQAVLTDFSLNEAKNFRQQESAPLIFLGKTENSFDYILPLPFKLARLQALLTSLPITFENDVFLWDMAHRHLKNKKTGEVILLTEKENELIYFLKKQPHQTASRETLLQNVWQYTLDTETHTVESTLYTLRQKLDKYADKLIRSTDTGYCLV